MNASLIVVAVLLCIVFVVGAGCTANRPWRTNYAHYDPAKVGQNSPTNVIEYQTNYDLGFVEFDEQGWFWDPGQLRFVEEMIRRDADIGQTTNAAGIVMLVFVHGWQDNAASDNEKVGMVRQVLAQISDLESGNPHPRKVVGVYCGWRGMSMTIPIINDLTFWSRKNTAYKVGGYGAMTELLVTLEHLQQASNDALPTNAPRTELIIVGHSFGAQAVYSAISQIVAERFVDTIKEGQVLKPLGDQVILLSPAFEASRYFDLNQLAISIHEYPTNQRPVLSIFTSEGDWATHYVFPIGRFFSTLFQRNRDADQRKAGREAVGWYETFVTHDLKYKMPTATAAASGTNGVSTFNFATGKHELHNRHQLHLSAENIRLQRAKWHPNNKTPATYDFDDAILEPKQTFRPGDPLLVVSVDKKIMSGHDDINNPVLINFLENYILFCEKDSQK